MISSPFPCVAAPFSNSLAQKRHNLKISTLPKARRVNNTHLAEYKLEFSIINASPEPSLVAMMLLLLVPSFLAFSSRKSRITRVHRHYSALLSVP